MSKASKKEKPQCGLLDGIDKIDSDFAQFIRDTCLERLLLPGMAPVTFILPIERARAEMVELAYSGSVGDVDKAVKMFTAYILPFYLPKGADFKSTSPLANRLEVKLEVESASSKEVVFAGGLKIQPTDRYHPLSSVVSRSAGETALWIAHAGEAPIDGEKVKLKLRRKPQADLEKKTVKGGGNSMRALLAGDAIARYVEWVKSGGADVNPLLAQVVGLMSYLQKEHSETYAKALPFIGGCDFMAMQYFLIEPFKTSEDFLIEDSIIESWAGAEITGDDALETYNGMTGAGLASCRLEGDSSILCAADGKRRIQEAIDAVKSELLESVGTDPATLLQSIQEKYMTLYKDNRLGPLSGVLPDAATGEKMDCRALWADMLRGVFRENMRGFVIHHSNTERVLRLTNLQDLIYHLTDHCTGDDHIAELFTSKDNLNRQLLIVKLSTFIDSDDFLHLPICDGPASSGLTLGGGRGAPVLSGKAMASLRLYLMRHKGKLPDEIVEAMESARRR